ncbi:MAG: LytTR family DNA-binding domain-containing protein [Oscillospiraceae bacterium]
MWGGRAAAVGKSIEVVDLQEKYINIVSKRKNVVLNAATILYVIMNEKSAEIHVAGGEIYKTRMSLGEIEKSLGDGFIKVHRGCVVSAMAIHNITDTINLSNGESLEYTVRKKKSVIEQLRIKQQNIIRSFAVDGVPATEEEYRSYYKSFDDMPFAFTDIEMIFNEEKRAVDWIFRYGNDALARLEKMPKTKLIGSSFGSLFNNMDSKWLNCYERSALYGEMLEMIDYSPEVDRYLKVICFPTFKGHCGCILFDITDIRFTQNSSDAQNAMRLYFGGAFGHGSFGK